MAVAQSVEPRLAHLVQGPLFLSSANEGVALEKPAATPCIAVCRSTFAKLGRMC